MWDGNFSDADAAVVNVYNVYDDSDWPMLID
jgi:hypothetical protein